MIHVKVCEFAQIINNNTLISHFLCSLSSSTSLPPPPLLIKSWKCVLNSFTTITRLSRPQDMPFIPFPSLPGPSAPHQDHLAIVMATAYHKHFIPLESNPELFTQLMHQLGGGPSLTFQDISSLDDPSLLAFIE